MTIYNFGSINIDNVYNLQNFPQAGETLTTLDYQSGLGGKGLNQSVAALRAGAPVMHIGSVNRDDTDTLGKLGNIGLDTGRIMHSDFATGHAIIYVDQNGENTIVIHGGANRDISEDHIRSALADITGDDILLLQNETANTVVAAQTAKDHGARVIYSAAPFDADAVRDVLPFIDLLVMNESEFAAVTDRIDADALRDKDRLVTLGAKGARYEGKDGAHETPAFRVDPVDTTGAGDTFIGAFAAATDAGKDIPEALRFAAAASALQVTRQGAVNAIPLRTEIIKFLDEHVEK